MGTTLSNTPTSTEQVGTDSEDGKQFGKSADSKISFYGAAPMVQPSVTQQTTATTGALRADLDSIINALDTLGLVAKT